MSPKKTTRKRRPARRPARIKEAQARYAVPLPKTGSAALDLQLEFSICLPAGADAEAFTDQLVALVEAFKGTVGGGTVAAAK